MKTIFLKEQKSNSISYRSHNDRKKLVFMIVKFFTFFFNFKKKITAGQKIIAKFQDFHSQILLNDFDFWQFSRDLGYVMVSGKFGNLNIFALFGLWKSWTKKVPETQIFNFWRFH